MWSLFLSTVYPGVHCHVIQLTLGVLLFLQGTPTIRDINFTNPPYFQYFICSYDSPLQHLDQHKTHPFMYPCLLSMCIYVWVWIVVCTLRHMFFWRFFCHCVCVCMRVHEHVCSDGLRLCALTFMVKLKRKRQQKENPEWTVECAWFGDYIGRVRGETQNGASAARQMRGWESAWLWLHVASVEAFCHIQSRVKGWGSLLNCICLSHLCLSESLCPSVCRGRCLDSDHMFQACPKYLTLNDAEKSLARHLEDVLNTDPHPSDTRVKINKKFFKTPDSTLFDFHIQKHHREHKLTEHWCLVYKKNEIWSPNVSLCCGAK